MEAVILVVFIIMAVATLALFGTITWYFVQMTKRLFRDFDNAE